MLDWLTAYRTAWLRPDLIAGLIAAAVVIPKAMAYATVAGLPVEVGLYTALVPMVVYAVLGTSRPLSVSTTTTIAILTGTQIAVVAPSAEHPEDETFPGLLMVRPEGRIFFANSQRIGDQILPLVEAAQPKVLALDFGAVFDIEYSALKMLIEGEERLRERGILLWLVALNPEALAMVQRSSLGETLGCERLLFNLQAAVERHLAQTR